MRIIFFIPSSSRRRISACHHSRNVYASSESPLALKWNISAFFVITLLCLTLLFSNNVAAAPTDKAKLSGVIAVINFLLLSDEETSIKLKLNEVNSASYDVDDTGFTAGFNAQNTDVELCFNLSSTQLQLMINGIPQTATNQVSTGENCYTIDESLQGSFNIISFQANDGRVVQLSNISLEPKHQTTLSLASLTRSSWDEKAVRKVLRIFAFGGHALDSQISEWADMQPRIAIAEMLNFQQHNLKLSPVRVNDNYSQTATQYGEFTDFVTNYLSSPSANLPIDISDRERFAIDRYAFDETFQYMVTTRGLNPFRQMVGFWETNYHLAVNLNSDVTNIEMAEFYDVIMRAHESGVPYQRVLGAAAKAAAPASQYGHENNEWVNNFCFCNQDFAREIHQLYYGIFGAGDEDHHENVTIPNTATMLTGMKTFNKVVDPRFPNDFPRRFLREYLNHVRTDLTVHHGPALNILRQSISGTGPLDKIDALMEHSIEHPESLKNLPVMIISVIADDNLDEVGKEALRTAWVSMGSNKQFLSFIHAYAMSDMFHSPKQRKYMSSFWRAFYFANKFNTHNLESIQAGQDGSKMGYSITKVFRNDDVETFKPRRNVFGGQTSLDAADSATIFEDNYNEASRGSYIWRRGVGCDSCDLGSPWFKDWGAEIPQVNGEHKVSDVAAWIWKHFNGSYDNYTALERSHLITILGATNRTDGNRNQNLHFDLPFFLCIYNDRIAESESPNDALTLIQRAESDCRHSGGYSADEARWLNKLYSTQELSGVDTHSSTYNPAVSDGVIPSLINQLGQINMPLLSANDELRLNANRRINYAMAFISATPFMFVESGE